MTYCDPTIGQGAASVASGLQSQILSNKANAHANLARAHSAADDDRSTTVAPKRGTWFDPSLDFRDPEGDALTTAVLSLIDDANPRQRKLRKADAENRYAIVRAILANGFRCQFYRRPNRVSFYGRNNGYKDFPGRPSWLNQGSLPNAIRQLADAGIIHHRPGRWREAASTYQIGRRLSDLADVCGVTEHSLTYPLASDQLVRLRKVNSKTPYASFDQTDDTCLWTAQLAAYNAFVRQQDIDLAVTEDEQAEWLEHWNERRRSWKGKDNPSLIRPERFQTDLYRQFNNGSFDQGGRLYGAWWINTPGWLRQRIMINGKPTVELDYSCYHIGMLYHERGHNLDGDAYRLDELTACEEENGLPPDYFRDGMKQFANALINGRLGGRPHMAEIKDFTPETYFKRPLLRRLFEARHAPIADAFGTGEGLRLQRLDSGIALSIITQLRQQGIVALPVHDSFIAPEDREEELSWLMEQEYKSIFGYLPKMKKSVFTT